ncbi:hydroxysteroid 11-beta-dehydrogenase 1-like protein isoform X8 [Chlorocebus sabaeus]|uniref:hydroxysteroid 11-beta-dehydrogenase 1-like protein isoform X8 n=1 Tax=Chlorocebus sabaeus TaxID=60711 RepID=UPI003BF9E3E7
MERAEKGGGRGCRCGGLDRWWLWRGGRGSKAVASPNTHQTRWLWARPVPATSVPCPSAGPQRTMKVLLLTGLGALFFAYYWDDNFDPASLQGARVLLTGASAGVGEELAYHYARLGSHLVLTAHTEALLQKVVGNCRKLGAPKVFYIAADMASPEAPESVVQFALDKLDRRFWARRAGLSRAEPHRRRPGRHASPHPPGDALAHAGAPLLRGPSPPLDLRDRWSSPFAAGALPTPEPALHLSRPGHAPPSPRPRPGLDPAPVLTPPPGWPSGFLAPPRTRSWPRPPGF